MGTEMYESHGWQLSSLIFQKSWEIFGVIGNNAVQYFQYRKASSIYLEANITVRCLVLVGILFFTTFFHSSVTHIPIYCT